MHGSGDYFHVEYLYEVDGERFTSDMVRYSERTSEIADTVTKYPANTEVRVFYDPDSPHLSTLETVGPNAAMYRSYAIVIIAFLLVVGWHLYWHAHGGIDEES